MTLSPIRPSSFLALHWPSGVVNAPPPSVNTNTISVTKNHLNHKSLNNRNQYNIKSISCIDFEIPYLSGMFLVAIGR